MRRTLWISSAIILTLGLGLGWLALNDEPLDEQTQRWLAYQQPPVPAQENGYVALVGLESAHSDYQARAASMLQALQTLDRGEIEADEQAITAAQQPLAQRDPRLPKFDFCNPKSMDDCVNQLRAQAQTLDALAGQHAALLQRLAHAQALPRAQEVPLLGLSMPILYPQSVKTLRILQLREIVRRIDAGENAAALQAWATQYAFWQRMARGSHGLIMLMISNSELQRSQQLLAALVKAQPELKPLARQHAQALLQASHTLPAQFSLAMVGEFQVHAQGYQHINWREFLHRGQWDELHLLLAYQPKATQNLARRQMANQLASAVLPDWIDPVSVTTPATPDQSWLNHTGEVLASISSPDFAQYRLKLENTAAHAAALAQQLQ